MDHSPQAALEAIRSLGSLDEIRAAADAGATPGAIRTNSHVHLPPNFSAFETVEQVVQLADEQDVRALGVSNYYDYRVYGPFVAECRRRKVLPVFGLEIISTVADLAAAGVRVNDPNNPGRMYICGKGITGFAAPSPRAAELLETIRAADRRRMAEMVAKVGELFAAAGVDVAVTEESAIQMVCRRHGCQADQVVLQERHIAQAFQEALFTVVPEEARGDALTRLFVTAPKSASSNAVGIQGELRSNLMKAGKPAFVAEAFLSFEEARELILALGGIPCYPTLADGSDPICGFETPIDELVGELAGRGIPMAEFIPLRNDPEVLGEYVRAMRKAGIAVVGGTEHNTLDLAPIEPACLGGAPVPDDVKEIFREGLYVAIAHQFLTLHGETGFVDAAGVPNAAYATADERIAALAAIGQAVAARWLV